MYITELKVKTKNNKSECRMLYHSRNQNTENTEKDRTQIKKSLKVITVWDLSNTDHVASR